MRPTAPASTTSSPTSTRSASRRTAAAPASAAASCPPSAPRCAAASRSRATTRSTTARCSARCAEACRGGGVTFVEGTVAALEPGPTLVLADGRRLGPDLVVLAAGTGLPAIDGLAGAGLPPLRPVKGHILRLGRPTPPSPVPLLARTVRGLVHGRSVYLVPRRDGSVVVGATVEERGTDTAVRAGAVHELLVRRPGRSSPASTSSSCSRRPPGLRPATPDNTPRIGWTALDGVLAAVGHYRNGILLAPLTAAAVVDLVGRAPGGAAHRGAGAGVSALALRVNGEPVEVRPGATIADLVAGAHGRGRPQGRGRRRRPLRRPTLGVGDHPRPRRLPGRGGERRRRRLTACRCAGRCRSVIVRARRPVPESSDASTPAPGPTAFVLAGGGTKGSFEVGVLQYLVGVEGIAPDIITATSAGAIAATVLAQARTLEEFADAGRRDRGRRPRLDPDRARLRQAGRGSARSTAPRSAARSTRRSPRAPARPSPSRPPPCWPATRSCRPATPGRQGRRQARKARRKRQRHLARLVAGAGPPPASGAAPAAHERQLRAQPRPAGRARSATAARTASGPSTPPWSPAPACSCAWPSPRCAPASCAT